LQKKKAEGPTVPEQPAKKQKLPPPGAEEVDHIPMATKACDVDALKAEVEVQGNRVRELKAAKADKVS